jgi:predicted lipoprotein with Yx(FWY)xxD motif
MARTALLLLVSVLLVLASCGDNDNSSPSSAAPTKGDATTKPDTAPKSDESIQRGGATASSGRGATITVGDSSFGSMLFASNERAIYIFEKDPRGDSVCYGECAEAWPPVFTEGEPRARDGVKDALLGTVKRRDGRLQVSYAGKPLYFYAHEEPGEVRCHNVNLNGGLWWVVGPDGKRRP